MIVLDNIVSRARTSLLVAGVMALALLVGEVHGHSRGVDDERSASLQDYNTLLRKNDQLAVTNAAQEQRITDLTKDSHLEVPHVDFYIPAPGLAPVALPDPGYTNRFVCMWNRPILAAGGDAGLADASTCAGTPDTDALSGATRDDVLNNEIENMGRCAIAYHRLATLQQAVRNAGAPHENRNQ